MYLSLKDFLKSPERFMVDTVNLCRSETPSANLLDALKGREKESLA